MSGPTKHLLTLTFYSILFYFGFDRFAKMDHFDLSFVIWKVSRSRKLTKPTLLDPMHLPGSLGQTSFWHFHFDLKEGSPKIAFRFKIGVEFVKILGIC